MNWIILIATILLLYRFFQIVSATKQPRQICKRHTWVEAAILNPTTREIAPILFCSVCKMMPTSDIENPTFLEIER